MTNFTFAFPGQGSQSVAMLAELAEKFPVVVDTYKEASEWIDKTCKELKQLKKSF